MREILYRAKAINRIEGREYYTNYKNGDWVYGLVTRLYDERFPNLSATMTNTDGVSNIDVDYKTISEFTGLTDKNGTKIFERDIVKCTDKTNGYDFTAVVLFGNPNARYDWGFQLKQISGEKANTDILLWVEMEESGAFIEVIGNIFDNPELLKGGEGE